MTWKHPRLGTQNLGEPPPFLLDPDPLAVAPEPEVEPRRGGPTVPSTGGCWLFTVLVVAFLVFAGSLVPAQNAPRAARTAPVPVYALPVVVGVSPVPSVAVEASAVPTNSISATATWCAPTPTQCQSWGGNAKLAGVNSFRYGDEPYLVRVSRAGRQVTVLVVSYCACLGTEHAIDLSPAAFAVLAPLSRGRIDVVLEWPVPELPRTDADLRMQREVLDDHLYEETP